MPTMAALSLIPFRSAESVVTARHPLRFVPVSVSINVCGVCCHSGHRLGFVPVYDTAFFEIVNLVIGVPQLFEDWSRVLSF